MDNENEKYFIPYDLEKRLNEHLFRLHNIELNIDAALYCIKKSKCSDEKKYNLLLLLAAYIEDTTNNFKEVIDVYASDFKFHL